MISLAMSGRHSCAGKNSNLLGAYTKIRLFLVCVNHFISVSFFSRLHKTSKVLTHWIAGRLKEFIKGNLELKKKPWGNFFVNIGKITLCLNADKDEIWNTNVENTTKGMWLIKKHGGMALSPLPQRRDTVSPNCPAKASRALEVTLHTPALNTLSSHNFGSHLWVTSHMVWSFKLLLWWYSKEVALAPSCFLKQV